MDSLRYRPPFVLSVHVVYFRVAILRTCKRVKPASIELRQLYVVIGKLRQSVSFLFEGICVADGKAAKIHQF